ncbi:leucine-rich repeat protein [Levilactobacillus yiduensis]|uniref:leucine-rich repeat protein n=1 Tax=Levilactobacillus yiduensis TaxID=2953880 RepID=UPI000EF2AD95|nr:leucine-rich repeat protein [Levilactobacillus yiduensis]AYM03492.1 LPXTG cell wall anchor domain-containing protein [Levilactobacillus brevis]
MQMKQHYKMYKDGKHWVFAAITVAVMGLGAMTDQEIAHADTTAGTSSSQVGTTTNASATAKSVALTTSENVTTNAQSVAAAGNSTASGSSVTAGDMNADGAAETATSHAAETDADTEGSVSSAPTNSSAASEETSSSQPEEPTSSAPADDDATTNAPTVNAESDAPASQASASLADDQAQSAVDATSLGSQSGTGASTDKTTTPTSGAPVMAMAASFTSMAATLPATDQSDFTFTNNADGTVTLAGLSGEVLPSTVVIPTTMTDANGVSHNVTAIGEGAFFNQPSLTQNMATLVIGNGITSIGAYAFGYLNNIQVVDLSENHTLTNIGEGAFVSTGIYDLSLPETVQTIGPSAFEFNENLSSVNFSQATQLQSIGDLAFAGDPNLTLLNIPTLTTMGTAAFAGDTGLVSVTLGDGVQQIGDYAFSTYQAGDNIFNADTSLAVLNLGNGLQTIGNYAFTYDGGITEVDFPASLRSIGDFAFGAMTTKDADGNTNGGLTLVTFAPDSQLQTIGNSAFIYDTQLDNVTLPASLVSIGSQAFLANSSLSSINLPASLVTVGANAFTYDAALLTVDTSEAAALTTIETGAFEYAGLTGTLQLPATLTTIGDLAFAGNHLEKIQLNTNLATIGNNAFAYNALAGDLDLTGTAITTIGEEAFFGNQLTSVQVPTSTAVGTDAFSYNRINALTVGAGNASLALNQTVTVFTSRNQLKTIDDLFTTQIGAATNADLKLTGLTNGVTENNGQFTIPDGVNTFTFNWTLTDSTGLTYSGQYQVVLNDPKIQVANSTVWYGDSWSPSDNIVSATMTDGTAIPESEWDNFTVTITDMDGQPVTDEDGRTVTADTMTQTPGTYQVTYSYEGESATAIITVQKRQANFQLTGSATVTYNGQTPVLDGTGYTVTFSNGFVYTLKAGDLEIIPNVSSGSTSDAGEYAVVIDDATIERTLAETPAGNLFDWSSLGSTATLTIVPAELTVTVPNTQKAAGTTDPAFALTTTMANQVVTDSGLTITRQLGETAGTYQYVVNRQGLNPNYQVSTITLPTGLTINPVAATLIASDYTMTVGGATPTVVNFKAVATDTNALPVSASEITLNLGTADLTQAGDYPVTLTYDGVTQTVTLHVVAPTTGGGGSTTDPSTPDVTDPTEPSTPDPTDPTDPVDPTDPAPDVDHVTNDKGVKKGAGATIDIQAKRSAQGILKRRTGGIGAVIQPDSPAGKPATATTTLKRGGDGAMIQAAKVAKVSGRRSDAVKASLTDEHATNLPQTNETPTTWWTVLGILFGGLGIAGLRKRRHQ